MTVGLNSYSKELITIDWSLGNACNLDCTYCHHELKDGANPFPTIDKLRPAFDHLIDQCQDFSRIRLEFNGGEPTSSDALQQVMLENTNKNIQFKLYSNGTAPLSWWYQVMNCLDDLTLTYHLKSSYIDFKELILLLRDNVNFRVNVAITPERWFEGMDAYTQFKKIHPNVHIQLLFSNFTRGNNEYLKYSEEQWKEYYAENQVDIYNPVEVEQTIEFKRMNNLNNFYGHLCWAGYNQIVVDNFGNVYRGWCKSGLELGNVYKQTVNLNQQPLVCPKFQCKNGFDLQARKSENSWGIA